MCTVSFGNSLPYVPCGVVVGAINAGLLVVEQVTITQPTTVVGLGVVGNHPAQGVHGVLALYGDLNGSPAALKTSTNSAPIADGKNELPVVSSVALPAGTYWVGGVYDASAAICGDNSGTNPVAYVNVLNYPTVPTPFGTAMRMSSVNFNYYVMGTE
jgi:hypothetical protein